MRRIIFTAIFGMGIFGGQPVFSQYFQYSQYNFTSQRINPAMVATSDYASIGMIHRNQSAAGDISLKSNMLSVAYPLISRQTRRRWSGIGFTAMDDRAGGIFSTQEVSLSYAVNVPVSRFQTLSLGFKGLYQRRKIDLDGLFTGSQYVPDRGFDESMFNGENIQYLRHDFFTFSSGLYWQQTDRKGNRVAYWGLSIFDFNKPEDSFSGLESQLNSTLIFTGGLKVYEQDKLSVTPEVLFTRNASNNSFNVGFVTGYRLETGRGEDARIDILTKYVVGRSAIAGIQFHRANLSIGCSYDFPFFTRNAGNLGAVEVGVELRGLVDPTPRRRTRTSRSRKSGNEGRPVRPSASTARNKTPQDSQDEDGSSIDPSSNELRPDLKEVLQHKQDSVLASAEAGKIKHQPLLLEKVILHFNFQFNSSDLDEESTRYLDELIVALLDNPHLSIKLTGHTDNIGSSRFNQRLSLFRANAIKGYLVANGVESERIITDGRGMSEPLNDNKTEEDRAANRRVELQILYED